MIKKHIFTGFLTGLTANAAGMIIYILIFSERGLEASLQDAVRNNYLGKIIALGAALNFLPFFIFLKRNLIYHARGVLLATVIMAVVIGIIKFL